MAFFDLIKGSMAAALTGTSIPTIDADKVVGSALNIFYFLAGITAVIFIIIAGYQYTTSNGDSATVAKAKNTILYSVIGIIVIILAFAITNFVIGRVK